jgi:hypothetical protein
MRLTFARGIKWVGYALLFAWWALLGFALLFVGGLAQPYWWTALVLFAYAVGPWIAAALLWKVLRWIGRGFYKLGPRDGSPPKHLRT